MYNICNYGGYMIYTCSSLVSIPSHRLVFHHGSLSCEWHQCLQSEVSMIDVPHVIKNSRCKGPGDKAMSLYHGCNNWTNQILCFEVNTFFCMCISYCRVARTIMDPLSRNTSQLPPHLATCLLPTYMYVD